MNKTEKMLEFYGAADVFKFKSVASVDIIGNSRDKGIKLRTIDIFFIDMIIFFEFSFKHMEFFCYLVIRITIDILIEKWYNENHINE